MKPPWPAGTSGPRDPLVARVGGPTLAERNPTHPPVLRPAIRTAALGDSLRFSLKKTDGVGFEPTRRFHVCRFSRSANALGRLAAGTPLKTRTRRPRGPLRRRDRPPAPAAKSSQTETSRAKSRPLTRQVSDKSRLACLEMTRNDREWDPPPSPALSSQPRTRHAPWQFQFCLSQREADPISLLQLPAGHRHPSQGFVLSGFPLRGWTRLGGGRSGKHPAARGSAADENGQWRQDGGLGRLARRADMTGRGSQPPLAGSQRRNGDAGAPPPAVCWGGVDILHGAPVNAPASRG